MNRACITILVVIPAALLSAGCDLFGPGDLPTEPTPVRTLVITGPSRLEVGSTSAFEAAWRTSNNAVMPAQGAQWSVSAPERLSITSGGLAAALKSGTARITARVSGEEAEFSVLVTPKLLRLVVDGLPSQMAVGAFADVSLVAIADRGNGEERLSVADAMGDAGIANAGIRWSSLTESTLSVQDSVSTAGLGVARALAPGPGQVQGSVAGITATAATQVIGSGPTVPVVPPSTTPNRLVISCPSSMTLDETAFCRAEVTADGRTGPATDGIAWSTSNALIVSNNDWKITGVNIGTATIIGEFLGLRATAEVTVVAGANGVFDAIFTPISNTCPGAIHPVHEGIMTIGGGRGTLEMAGATQSYGLTFSVGAGALVSISGVSTFGGYTFNLALTQGESRSGFSGREDITGADGCAAAYRWLMTRKR